MLKVLSGLLFAFAIAGFSGNTHAWIKLHEGALELDNVHIRLSSAGTATVIAKTCDQCGEISVMIDRTTNVVGLDDKPVPDALVLGYTGGATIMYNFRTLHASQVVLWQ